MTLQLNVPDMACGACAETITKALLKIDPKASVKADLKSKQVIVHTQASEASVKEAITSAGYNPA